MNPYILFIDTETTDIPKRWDLPYSETENWPSAVQVSWIICSAEGNEIKRENHYVFEEDLEISERSLKVHGIAKNFLKISGKRRKDVLKLLIDDIQEYNPLVAGHFTEFDLHVLGTDLFRAGLENPFKNSFFYCTMIKSKQYIFNPRIEYMRLPQLYNHLFGETMENSHNALIDAEITAKCFFEIDRRTKISEKDFDDIHWAIFKKIKFPTSKIISM